MALTKQKPPQTRSPLLRFQLGRLRGSFRSASSCQCECECRCDSRAGRSSGSGSRRAAWDEIDCWKFKFESAGTTTRRWLWQWQCSDQHQSLSTAFNPLKLQLKLLPFISFILTSTRSPLVSLPHQCQCQSTRHHRPAAARSTKHTQSRTMHRRSTHPLRSLRLLHGSRRIGQIAHSTNAAASQCRGMFVFRLSAKYCLDRHDRCGRLFDSGDDDTQLFRGEFDVERGGVRQTHHGE